MKYLKTYENLIPQFKKYIVFNDYINDHIVADRFIIGKVKEIKPLHIKIEQLYKYIEKTDDKIFPCGGDFWLNLKNIEKNIQYQTDDKSELLKILPFLSDANKYNL